MIPGGRKAGVASKDGLQIVAFFYSGLPKGRVTGAGAVWFASEVPEKSRGFVSLIGCGGQEAEMARSWLAVCL